MLPRCGVRPTDRTVAGLLALALASCASPGSQRIVGPDGSAMAHVHCGSDQGACFRIAGELCPSGYELKPVLSGNDGNFLVRCRDARVAQSVQVCPPIAPGVPSAATAALVTPRAQPNQDAWPPSTEPWPAAYPWPPPETSAAVGAQPAGAVSAKPPSDSVDIGY
jgi:hypothetical protein